MESPHDLMEMDEDRQLLYVPVPDFRFTESTTSIEQPYNLAVFNVITLNAGDVPGALLKKPAQECTVIQLQRWLEGRKLNKQGVRDDLIQRVEAAGDAIPIDPNVDHGAHYHAKASKKPSMKLILAAELLNIMQDAPVSG